MYTVLKDTYWAIVLLIRSFVLPRPRFRRRRGLLKVPSIILKSSQRHLHYFVTIDSQTLTCDRALKLTGGGMILW